MRRGVETALPRAVLVWTQICCSETRTTMMMREPGTSPRRSHSVQKTKFCTRVERNQLWINFLLRVIRLRDVQGWIWGQRGVFEVWTQMSFCNRPRRLLYALSKPASKKSIQSNSCKVSSEFDSGTYTKHGPRKPQRSLQSDDLSSSVKDHISEKPPRTKQTNQKLNGTTPTPKFNASQHPPDIRLSGGKNSLGGQRSVSSQLSRRCLSDLNMAGVTSEGESEDLNSTVTSDRSSTGSRSTVTSDRSRSNAKSATPSKNRSVLLGSGNKIAARTAGVNHQRSRSASRSDGLSSQRSRSGSEASTIDSDRSIGTGVSLGQKIVNKSREFEAKKMQFSAPIRKTKETRGILKHPPNEEFIRTEMRRNSTHATPSTSQKRSSLKSNLNNKLSSFDDARTMDGDQLGLTIWGNSFGPSRPASCDSYPSAAPIPRGSQDLNPSKQASALIDSKKNRPGVRSNPTGQLNHGPHSNGHTAQTKLGIGQLRLDKSDTSQASSICSQDDAFEVSSKVSQRFVVRLEVVACLGF